MVSDGLEAPPRRTLLIVDDEEGPRQSLWAIFKDDYDILLADSGAQALRLISEHRVDAAVLDIRMRDMLGTELLEKLKKIDPAIEVVMLTAYQTVETARQAIRHGACEYLSKPFDIGTMCDAVLVAMERRAISDQIRANTRMLHDLQDEMGQQQVQNELVRTKGEIYASILHDINSPLTVISGLIDMMHAQVADATRVEGMDLTKMKDRLAQTNRQLYNCIQISRRYLSFLKPRTGGEAISSVNQVLADLRELLQHHPRLGENQLAIHPLQQDAFARINGIDLIQVLLNLTINALQSTPEPHIVEVTCESLREPLHANQFTDTEASRFLNRSNFNNTAPLVRITVRDNGPGMSPTVLQRLFEPYFTTRATGQGTGLGLSIVHRLVSEAQGAILLRSAPGEGASFTIYLAAGDTFESP